MGGIVPSHELTTLGVIPLVIPSSLLGYSGALFDLVPSSLLGYSVGVFGPVPTFLLGYSVGVPGPVPGLGCPSSRQSLFFFRQDLCYSIVVFVVVVIAVAVVLCGTRGGSVNALAAPFARPRARGAVLAEVSGGA